MTGEDHEHRIVVSPACRAERMPHRLRLLGWRVSNSGCPPGHADDGGSWPGRGDGEPRAIIFGVNLPGAVRLFSTVGGSFQRASPGTCEPFVAFHSETHMRGLRPAKSALTACGSMHGCSLRGARCGCAAGVHVIHGGLGWRCASAPAPLFLAGRSADWRRLR